MQVAAQFFIHGHSFRTVVVQSPANNAPLWTARKSCQIYINFAVSGVNEGLQKNTHRKHVLSSLYPEIKHCTPITKVKYLSQGHSR